MPNQRAAGQKQVIVTMKEDFLSLVDGNLEKMGFGDRAQFIRTAVYEKMQAAGLDVERNLMTPPSRAGKGGRPRKVEDSFTLNDEATSTEAPERKQVTYPTSKKASKKKTK